MSERPDKVDLDDLIDELRSDCRWYARQALKKNAMLEFLQELRDGMTPEQRLEVRDLEDAYGRPAKRERYRKPARPEFGGAES